MPRANNLFTFMWRLSWNLGASAFLEPSGPVRACTRFALEFHFFYFFLWRCSPTRTTVSSFLSFLNHKQRPSKVTRTHLDEWSAVRRELYLTTHDLQKTSIPPTGFEPTISAGDSVTSYSYWNWPYETTNVMHWILFIRSFVWSIHDARSEKH